MARVRAKHEHEDERMRESEGVQLLDAEGPPGVSVPRLAAASGTRGGGLGGLGFGAQCFDVPISDGLGGLEPGEQLGLGAAFQEVSQGADFARECPQGVEEALAVVEAHVGPQPRVPPEATRGRGVAVAAADAAEGLGRGHVDEGGGDEVGQMAGAGHQAVVLVGVERADAGAEGEPEVGEQLDGAADRSGAWG